MRVATEAPLLAHVASEVPDLGPLRSLIEDAIDEQAGVRDSASPALASSIRHDLAAAHERLLQRMQTLLASSTLRTALQEAIIVMRDGRYVLPVKADFRGAVRGVVHDTSTSGATLYVEPLAVVELGNAWRELQLQERHEVERVLRELSGAAGDAEAEIEAAVDRLAHLDVAQAKARLAAALDARDLAVPGARQPWLVAAPGELRLIEARHPLLTGTVVPISIRVGGDFDALLITGPNTGGKTVALKTAGLLCLMALAGLPVPARAGSQVPVFEQVFADIGDEQSIEQSLSTFSGTSPRSSTSSSAPAAARWCCSTRSAPGTDPTEGAALGIAIVERLVHAGVALIATTHHSELKVYAHRTARVTNASVEFDLKTLRPTYRLSIGLPGQSNALAIAGNLGMPADVMAAARAGLSHEERELESLLGDLRAQLAAAEERATVAATAAAEAEALRADLQHRIAALDAETARIREDARAAVRRELRDVDRYLERTKREVEAARLEQAQADFERATRAAERIEPEPAPAPVEPRPASSGPIEVRPGVTVWLRGMHTPGEALSEPDAQGAFTVQLGALRTRARIEQVERTGPPAPPERLRATTIAVSAPPDVGIGSRCAGRRWTRRCLASRSSSTTRRAPGGRACC